MEVHISTGLRKGTQNVRLKLFPKPLKNRTASRNEHAIWSSASVNVVYYSSMVD